MGRKLNLDNKRFGKLIATNKMRMHHGNTQRLCYCDCGNTVWIQTGALISGHRTSCGCWKNQLDIDGQRFGKLIVTNQRRGSKRLCYCDCGKQKWIELGNLRQNFTKSCGCQWHSSLPLGKSARNYVLDRYKRQAKMNGRTWRLTDAQFDILTSDQCIYCGRPPNNIFRDKRRNGSFTYSSIDRLDNTKGYTPENTVSCCAICNRAKRAMTLSDFLSWIKDVKKHEVNL